MKKSGAIFAALAVSVAAAAQTTESQARSAAAAFAQKAGISFQPSQAAARKNARLRYWEIVSGETVISVSDVTGCVVGFLDMKRENDIAIRRNRTGQVFFSSQQAAWSRGDQLIQLLGLGALGFQRGDLKWNQDKPDVRPSLRSRVILNYWPKPEGRDTYGNGNRASFVFDLQDGALVGATIIRDWSYGPGTTSITSTKALELARAVMKQRLPQQNVGNYQISLYYPTPNGSLGSAKGKALLAQKQARLCYVVAFPKTTVFIDAITGECLGGGSVGR
jgi:hypothetical protein